MLNDLIPLTLVVVLVPLAAIMILRTFGKTKRTRRPLNSFRIAGDPLAKDSKKLR